MDIAAAFSEAKSLPDDALHKELASPSGMIPGYIILGELHERKSLRGGSTAAANRPSMTEEISIKGYSRGGMVAGINPFNAYIEGLKNQNALAHNPSNETGQMPLGAPSPLRPAPELSSLIPQRPGQPAMLEQPKHYARGGLVELLPHQRQLLDAIAGRESAGRYDVIYGGGKITDFSRHPRRAVPIRSGPNAGQTSSAAGRYQFLGSTWDQYQKKLGLPDFSPASQDLAAWELAKDTYGPGIDAALQSGNPDLIAGVGRKLHGQWTSLPGGIEQGQGAAEFVNRFTKSTGAVPAGSTGGVSALAAAQASGQAAAQGAQAVARQAAVAPKNPMGGLMALMAMQAASKKEAPPPPPAPAAPPRFRPAQDPELLTAMTSQTPDAYLRRRGYA